MTLPSGTRLGPYEVVAPLGAGGMGEVYRARDTRLGREVAVKVLPDGIASDPQHLARFEQEARAASALNHPSIVTIHDVGREGATSYIAMELVSGSSLRDVLSGGALPVKKALHVAAALADALAAAHERGIVHRDLKPENVIVAREGFVKILDFGLAKLAPPLGPDGSALETTPQVTADGTVLGTVGYMAPEQASGRAVDFRADQFSLGVVLHELLTGRRAFARATAAETLAAIIRDEPEPPAGAPPPVRWTLERCLAKDPHDRFDSTRDLARELATLRDHISDANGSAAAPTTRPRASARAVALASAGAGILAGAGLVLLVRAPRTPEAAPRVVRFQIPPPAEGGFFRSVETTTLAVSPDGSRIAFMAGPPTGNGPTVVWLRDLAAAESKPLAGTDDANSLFWSPDGRSLAFFTRSKLKRVDPSRGGVVEIASLEIGGGKSGTWGSQGDIVFGNIQGSALWRVPAAGGSPEVVLRADPARGETRALWPCFLSDGKRFLYTAKRRDGRTPLMLFTPGSAPREVLPAASAAQIAAEHLVSTTDGVLVARPFDERAGRATGAPVPVADHVRYFLSNGSAVFGASRAGTIAWSRHADVNRLVWFDAEGRAGAALGAPGDYLGVWLSRDGQRALYDRAEPGIGTWDIYSYDLARGVETRLSSTPDTEVSGRELPRHHAIAYSATREAQPQLYLRRAGSDSEERLVPGEDMFQSAEDVSPDETTLVYTARTADSPFDVWVLPLEPRGPPRRLLKSAGNKRSVRFSPDGRLLAFVSDAEGRPQVFVMPYPGPGEPVRVSSEQGGLTARWSPDGRRLFYLTWTGSMMVVPVQSSPALSFGAPSELFAVSGRRWNTFDVARDGRFLAVVPELDASEQPLDVVVGWRPPER